MTPSPNAPSPLARAPLAPAAAPSTVHRALRAVAIAACLPYLALKVAWVAGSRIGIPEGSVLLERPGLMAVANSVTILMDAAVVVLALLLTQRWGLRVRAWLLAFPMWVATGLLTPIMIGFPVDLLVRLVAGGESGVADASEPFLDEWVFPVVYGGFIVQGLALGALFVRYAWGRWGHVWRGTVWDLSPSMSGPSLRAAAAVASLALLPLAALHLSWALGATGGLTPAQIAGRTAGFHALEALRALYAAAAVTGVLLLAFRRGRSLPVGLPLALGWAGSGAVGCWGGWRLLASLSPASDPAKEPTALLTLVYAGEMIVGTALAGCVAVFLLRRHAAGWAAR
ncbi:hypothetical protein [Streptomyces sp. TRM49041]|uniref:hypothetical protein n=1 Tax=Streptomyces sp. TRM49041 TaxID=2603216 RepID=UPI0016568C23|nr:hypothetical protein [Streptomyces sp. TRM49041]